MANVLQPAQANGTQAHALITRHAIEEARSRNVRILVAEDYPTNQQIAVRHLKSAGFDVVLAEDGAKAVALFEQQRFDLVMMDIQMPEMDGYEATRRIRDLADSDRAGTPIIAMTAHVMEGYRAKCLQAGMDDYISKPLKRDGLIAMALKWTNQNPDPEAVCPDSPPPAPETHPDQAGAQLPMDIPKALAEFENDRVFLREVVDEFLSTVESQLETIQTALSSNDFQRIQKESHAIKGGAANLTAMALSAAASALEQAGKDQDPDRSRDLIKLLNRSFADLTRFIHGSDAL